ncbi:MULTISPECIES: hypothetical protein [unclassified Mesorhizobium]|nr:MULTISPECIES: hypothetical protein [unclassified Mesorhizobium]MBN9253472.1 hypothetical protein [Mesorhizobium sp.]MBN9273975.1 hypothetical protein [Mesorhizobium sp.]
MDIRRKQDDSFLQSVCGAADGRKAMIPSEATLASAKSGRFEQVRF